MQKNERNLSKSAQSVQDVLNSKGMTAKVIELPSSTRTADDAAKSIGCKPDQIMKSLIFRTKVSGRPILILASGVNRVDEKMIAEAIGEEIGKADAAFTKEVTGFAIGGIPPVGHVQAIETLIDEDLFQHEEVWAAAGTPNAVFSIDSSKVLELTSGSVIAIHK